MTSTLLPIIPPIYDVLFDFAQSDGFWANLETAFGTSYDVVKTTELRQQWQSRNFSQLPPIEVLSGEVLGTAKGAYAVSTNKIYLSESFFASASLDALVAVILEEIGHYVDAQVNAADSPGDEGAIFAALVQGIPLLESELQTLKQENDFATIFVDGQEIQIEQASLSRSGGLGGTNQTLQLDPLAPGQTEKNVTLTYFYEHFSIPDQFEVRYAGKPIFNTGGLVSGSKSGSVTFKQVQGQDFLNIVVTAPQSGTAWNFSVNTDNAQINFDGLVGDAIKLDFGNQRGNVTLKSLPNSSKGKLINEKGENATVGTLYTTLYYVPTVNGAISSYGQDKGHTGIGQVTFDVEDQDQKSLTVSVNVADGFSKTGEANPVKTGTGKLDIYTQQQRLAYLGFPGSTGSPLVVDGVTGGEY